MSATDYILKVITLFGGLALFLFGMDVMGKALERQAGGKLQTILAKMSNTIIKGFLLGLGVTAVIQSSSATTVMVVGFVNSGIMTLHQAVGVIMGANVGTTVTAWILSLGAIQGDSLILLLLKPTALAPILGVVGIVLYMFTKSPKKQGLGTILLGFLALMTGMDLMSGAMEFLEGEQWFADLMVTFSNPILGVLMGAALTAVIQSSSASVGILQSLSATGLVTFGNAIPIILGQNIGTCVTAMLGSVGTNRNARRTSLVHLYFNCIGVTLFMIVFYAINAVFPWPFLGDSVNAMNIAVVHTCFNLLTTMVLLPLNKVLVKLACATIRDDEVQTEEKTALLDERLIATPAVAVERAYEITGRMMDAAVEAVQNAVTLTHGYNTEGEATVRTLEEETDHYEDALGTYLVRLSAEVLAPADNRLLNTLLYTTNDIERIADHAVALAIASKEIQSKNVQFSGQARDELAVLERAIGDILAKTREAFVNRDLALAQKVEPQDQVIGLLVREIKARHVARLRNGKCAVEYGLALDDLLISYERIADHCSNIAVEMLQTAEGKMEAHEYLGALHAGESEGSDLFEELMAKYTARYSIPEYRDKP